MLRTFVDIFDNCLCKACEVTVELLNSKSGMLTQGIVRTCGRHLTWCRYHEIIISQSRTFGSWSEVRRRRRRRGEVGERVSDLSHDPSSLRRTLCDVLGGRGLMSSGVGGRRMSEWSRAVSEAEKMVGYPTSFMSLRCLLSDEISNVAMHMRKLVGSKHPLVDTAKRFIYDGTYSSQMRGLLVLLVAKAAGPTRQPSSDVIENMVSGIYPSQRSLAEITEMIHTAYLVHRGVVNLTEDDGPRNDMQFGNKMSVLSGDFLLANASTALAQLYNTQVVELISEAIANLATAEFTSMCGPDGAPVLPPGGADVALWERQTFLSSGSLLAHSCKGVMLLAQHDETWQREAYNFGRSMGYAYQLHEELNTLLERPGSESRTVSPTSMPVILHLEKQPEDRTTLLDTLTSPPSPANTNKVRDILSSTSSVSETREMTLRYREEALQSLSVFGASDARAALTNLVKAVTHI